MERNNVLRHLVLDADQYPPKARSNCAELSFFNVMMAATYFRRAAHTRHPNVARDWPGIPSQGWTCASDERRRVMDGGH